MSEKPQFDSLLGGNVELPSQLVYLKFAAARSKEIDEMTNFLSTSRSTKLAFQKLPLHMRRRAMSHNVKRLPRRLRQIHINQFEKSGTPQKSKATSRKYRRKLRNTIEKQRWLSTHLWHAKRFHMIEKWGLRLPYRSCDKAFRASYRATARHCLVQDISYNFCIEIEGNYESIVEKFKLVTNNELGLSLGAKAYKSGTREGSVTLFSYNTGQAHSRAIGNVFFNWRPSIFSKIAKVWLWVHVAYYNEVLEMLLSLFELQRVDMESDVDIPPMVPVPVPEYVNCKTNIKLLELRNELNRFRLTGPLSNAVLQSCFKISDIKTYSPEATWLSNFSEIERTIYEEQKINWENLKSIHTVTELPLHVVYSVIVDDPRVNYPKKRMKAVPDFEQPTPDILIENIPDPRCSFSVLFDNQIRKEVARSKVTNSEIAKKRSEFLIPGTSIDDITLRFPLPLMLIQRPGTKTGNYGSGWDLILPAAWAQLVWPSLIIWGARAGGLRETDLIDFEAGKPHLLYPDTEAGKKEELENSLSLKCKYFKKPMNRRTNFNKMKIVSPFNFNWELLISEWSSEKQAGKDFFVLRDRKILNNIQSNLQNKRTGFEKSFISKKPPISQISKRCIFPVELQNTGKGVPKNYAIICLPQSGDLEKVPEEGKEFDVNQAKRNALRKEHKSLLKRMRQRRIRAKRKGKRIEIDYSELKKYQQEMRKLWLPDAKSIKDSCSRKVIGFVTHGDFSFSRANASAVGYIVGGALEELLKLGHNKVLVRNPNSRHYKLCVLNIICD